MRKANSKTISHFLKCLLEKEIYAVNVKYFTELKTVIGRYNSNLHQIPKR